MDLELTKEGFHFVELSWLRCMGGTIERQKVTELPCLHMISGNQGTKVT